MSVLKPRDWASYSLKKKVEWFSEQKLSQRARDASNQGSSEVQTPVIAVNDAPVRPPTQMPSAQPVRKESPAKSVVPPIEESLRPDTFTRNAESQYLNNEGADVWSSASDRHDHTLPQAQITSNEISTQPNTTPVRQNEISNGPNKNEIHTIESDASLTKPHSLPKRPTTIVPLSLPSDAPAANKKPQKSATAATHKQPATSQIVPVTLSLPEASAITARSAIGSFDGAENSSLRQLPTKSLLPVGEIATTAVKPQHPAAAEPKKTTITSISSAYSDRRNMKTGSGTIIPRSVLGKRKVVNEEDGESARQMLPGSAANLPLTASHNSVPNDLPSWYADVRINKSTKSRLDRSMVAMLNTVRDVIGDLGKPSAVGPNRDVLWGKLRDQVHRVSHQNVDESLVKVCKLLESNGLPRIFVQRLGGTFSDCPYDISADARELFLKWCRHEFDPDILRGIKHSNWTILPDYPSLNCNYFGEGDLVSGQWWPRWCTW